MSREIFWYVDGDRGVVAAGLTRIHIVKGEKWFDVQVTFTKLGGRKRFFEYTRCHDANDVDDFLTALFADKKLLPAIPETVPV